MHRVIRQASSSLRHCASVAPLSTLAQSEVDVHDVIIVGSGMVGAAVAALLGKDPYTQHLRVTIVDKQIMEYKHTAVPGLRVSTITPATSNLLQQAGAWGMLQPPSSAAFSRMQVWCTGAAGTLNWDARDSGRAEMGWVVENGLMQHALLQQLPSTTKLVGGCRVQHIQLPEYSSTASAQLASVQLQDGRTLQARLVVGADGAGSQVRQMAGLRTIGWAYGQRGVVATVQTAEPNDTAWQRFLRTGPLALLPTRGGYSSIVWSTTPDAARKLESMSPEEFGAAINEAFRDSATGPWSLGLLGQGVELPPLVEGWVATSPKSFPLQMKHSGRYVRGRLALVGDAAHAVHPMAGQGVNLGYGDALQLATAISDAVRLGQDFGSLPWLQEQYERPRQRANVGMMAALDSLKAVFAADTPLIAGARSLGLGLLQAAGPVKNRIMQYAMGM